MYLRKDLIITYILLFVKKHFCHPNQQIFLEPPGLLLLCLYLDSNKERAVRKLPPIIPTPTNLANNQRLQPEQLK